MAIVVIHIMESFSSAVIRGKKCVEDGEKAWIYEELNGNKSSSYHLECYVSMQCTLMY